MLNSKKWVEHPGTYIDEELSARKWTQRDLAHLAGCTEQSVNLIINGKRGITPQMAKAFGKAFSISADYFINLQKLFEENIDELYIKQRDLK